MLSFLCSEEFYEVYLIELCDIRKSYTTGGYTQKALDGVSIAFRDCEFVAVLGPSGSGKTTLLNVVGGLDRADSGELVINGVSTADYRSKDWDIYRNHHIGFIFQSYNLIPHISILSNVELALTLSGVGRAQRKERAFKALEDVGLAEHAHKRPSQLSGGQMQRVAIARALVNDPDIVLADEPTGALDTDTGVAVMEILKDISKKRLVVMVTHNPELAEAYATRIVRLRDGAVTQDGDPYAPNEGDDGDISQCGIGCKALDGVGSVEGPDSTDSLGSTDAPDNADIPDSSDSPGSTDKPLGSGGFAKQGRASMSFLTALGLSFNNLMTKKGRTILTAIAGSIGIIGIAAILALSNGVNNYIAKVEEDTLSSMPISISKSSYDMTALLSAASQMTSGTDTGQSQSDSDDAQATGDDVIQEREIMSEMFSGIGTNDLVSLKDFIESGQTDIYDHVNAITYDYGITPYIYKADTSSGVTRLNPSPVSDVMGSSSGVSSYMMSLDMYSEMLDAPDLLAEQYDVLAGSWPSDYNECLLVLDDDGTINDYLMYHLGLYDMSELVGAFEDALDLDSVQFPDPQPAELTYDEVLGLELKVLPACDMYRYNAEQNAWSDLSDNDEFMASQLEQADVLRISGVVCANETTKSPALSSGIYYMPSLIDHLKEEASDSDIVKQQLADPSVDVFTGKTFEALQSEDAFDISEMFTIDEEALAQAFSFDTSAIEGSGFDIDLSSLSGGDALSSALSNLPAPDLSGLSLELDDQQSAAVQGIAMQISSGFLPYYYEKHPGESITSDTDFTQDFAEYLQTDDVKPLIEQVQQIAGEQVSSQMQSVMQDYMASTVQPAITSAMQQMMAQASAAIASQMQAYASSMMQDAQSAVTIDTEAFAGAFEFEMDEDDFLALMTSYANASTLTFESNLSTLGYATDDDLEFIYIYPKDFEEKEAVTAIIDSYNEEARAAGEQDKEISYTDVMGVLMSSVTRIVDTIAAVLIAFVSISLVVSSIMIGIITYISVLERKKEIGILRAMGASKADVANIFNAETFIEGLAAGVLAIAFVLLASIPVNAYVLSTRQVENVMSLPWADAGVLVLISVVLTLVAGALPAIKASRKNPVEALRSE